VLLRLEAGCSAPIGALGSVQGDTLTLEAVVASLDGRQLLRRSRSAPNEGPEAAARLGVSLAEELLEAGAARIAPLSA
jgi:hydroxymethylbilane synthase